MGSNVSLKKLGIRIQSNPDNLFPDAQSETNMFKVPPRQIELQFPFFLVATANGIECKNQQELKNSTLPILYKATLQNFTTLWLEMMESSVSNKIWKALSQCQNMGVCQGDILKVGNIIQLKLKHLVNQSFDRTITSNKIIEQDNYMRESVKDSMNNGSSINNGSGYWKCRICFQGEQSEDNPLLCLCKCEGSVKFTHFQCLQAWVRHKIKEVEHINYTEYEFAPLRCDLCKENFSPFFCYGGKLLSLIEKEPIKPPYAYLQAQEEGELSIRYFRVKLQEGMSISVGRSAECGIQLKSASVSRNHCALYYTHKQLFVKDLGSKLGTFLYSTNALYDFHVQSGIYLLIGSSLIQISELEGFSLSASLSMPACCGSSMKMKLKVEEDKDQKFTVTTSGNLYIFDFLD